MDYIKPADVAAAMVETGRRKLALSPFDLLIRGILSGAILGVATSLAFTGAVSTGQPLVGALISSRSDSSLSYCSGSSWSPGALPSCRCRGLIGMPAARRL
jgi:hypothetical protein